MPVGLRRNVGVRLHPLHELTFGKKLFSFLMAVLCLLFSSQVWAQDEWETTIVNEVFEGENLLEVIKHMQQTYHLKIAYERKLVRPYRVEAVLQQQSLEQAWESILSHTPLTCLFLGDDKLVIRRALPEDSSLEDRDSIGAEVHQQTYAAIVKDGETGERIPYATVAIAGTSRGTVANQEGFFTLSHLPSLQDSLIVSHLGYAPSAFALDSRIWEQKEVNLQPSFSVLKEVEVTDGPSIGLVTFSKKSGQNVVNLKKTDHLPQIGEKDIFRSLQLLPGISIANETSARLSIRGSSPDQNLVLFDGFPIYHLDHLYGFFSSINTDAIKDIRIYKGGFDAKYGGRASGVIDITGKSGNQYKPTASLGLNLLSMNLKTEAPLGEKGTVFLAFRRSYTDMLQSSLFNTLVRYADSDLPPLRAAVRPGQEEEESFYYYDAHVKLSYRPTFKDKLSLSFYQGGDDYDKQDDLQISTTEITYRENRQEKYKIGNTGLGLAWSRIWNDQLFSTFNLGYSHYYTNYQYTISAYEGEEANQTQTLHSLTRDNMLDEYTAKLDFEYSFNPMHMLDLGFFTTANEIVFEDQSGLQEVQSNFADQGIQSGMYLQHIYRPLEKLILTTGLRNTYYSFNHQWYAEPRISANYELKEGVNLKGSAGQYYQFINKANSDLGLNFDQDFWLLSGSEGLPVLSSQQYIGGISYAKNGWMLDAEMYHKHMSGLIKGSYESFVVVNGIHTYWNLNKIISDGKSRVNGLDVMLTKQWKHNSSSVSYSLASVKQQFDELNEGAAFYADDDQRHELKLVSQWDFKPWTISVNWLYGSGEPYSSPTEIAYENGNIRLIFSEKNNNRLPAYHRMDLSAGYHFKLGKGQAQVGLSVFNVYDHQNVGNRSFLFDRFGLFQSTRSLQVIQLVSVDQLLMERTLSIFLNFHF